jgi:predicted  nucleic acid-binding Zn-ribbon protein
MADENFELQLKHAKKEIERVKSQKANLEHQCKGLEQQKSDLQNRCTKLETKVRKKDEQIMRLKQLASVREYKACGKKVTFKSKFKADLRAKEAKQRAYLCPHCKHWHLTSKGVRQDGRDNASMGQ